MEYNEKIINLIKELSEERKLQNKHCTREPIYLVQSRKERVTNKDYSHVDLERLYLEEILDDDFYPTLDEIKDGTLRTTSLPCDLVMDLEECKNMEEVIDTIEDYSSEYEPKIIEIEYYWETVAYFLTEKSAKYYQQYQSHNLGVSRVYVVSPGYDNRGKFDKLLHLLDTEDFIIKETGE